MLLKWVFFLFLRMLSIGVSENMVKIIRVIWIIVLRRF